MTLESVLQWFSSEVSTKLTAVNHSMLQWHNSEVITKVACQSLLATLAQQWGDYQVDSCQSFYATQQWGAYRADRWRNCPAELRSQLSCERHWGVSTPWWTVSGRPTAADSEGKQWTVLSRQSHQPQRNIIADIGNGKLASNIISVNKCQT